jgi:hypothetical protein
MTTPVYDPAPFGKELVNSAATGAGLGTSAMALYYLLNGLHTAKVPATLLREPALTKKPTAVPADKKKKPDAVKKASGVLEDLYTAAGKMIPTTFLPGTSNAGPAGPKPPASPTVAHAGWRTAANVAALLGGMYGGRKLVNTVSQHKKKRDLSEEVDDARKQYFAALTGKEAAALDAAYEQFAAKQASLANQFAKSVYAPVEQAAKDYVGIPAWKMLLMTTLGTGAAGAHYAYNKTKEQSKARNLQRAQQARARLKAMQETPWVDPAELESLAAAAK